MSWERTQRSMLASTVGAGVGELFYLVDDKAQADLYYWLLKKRGVRDSKIFTDVATAYASMEAGQNDTLLVYPGDHITTSALTWDKDSTFIVGAGSRNQSCGPGTAIEGQIRFSSTTAAQYAIFYVTAHHVSMYNIQTYNNGANTGNLCDVKFGTNSRNFYAENCGFRGGNNATANAGATSGIPLYFHAEASAGNAARFKSCWIGNSGNYTRSAGPGCMYFAAGAAKGLHIEVEDCVLATRIETSGSAEVCLVHLAGNYATDRYLLFKNTMFYNFWENKAGTLDYAIVDANGTSHDTIVQGCALIGVDAWSNVTTHTWSVTANAGTDGGKGANVDVTP